MTPGSFKLSSVLKLNLIAFPPNLKSLNRTLCRGEKQKFLDGEILRLLELRVLEKCHPEEGQYLSNIFLKPKPNGKFCMILDLSNIKPDLTYKHFKMENLQTAMDIMQKGGLWRL